MDRGRSRDVPGRCAGGRIKPVDTPNDPFGARAPLPGHPDLGYYRLDGARRAGHRDTSRLPYTVRVLLEILLRNAGASRRRRTTCARWRPGRRRRRTTSSVPFLPARVILQDFTGVPAVVDLAAMRDAMARAGARPERVNPLVPADLVIDHSVQVDAFGTRFAFARNVEREYERNGERYALLRWAQQAFEDFRVVPPGMGIVHQVNLEYLGPRRAAAAGRQGAVAFPDTLVGTDSHTTMINALGVLGWGVGGIEAEAVLLGQPLVLADADRHRRQVPRPLRTGVTATDLVLTLTEMLRKHGVVGKFVEFCGAGLSRADARRTARRSPTCRPSTARPPRCSRSTPRRCATCDATGARRRRRAGRGLLQGAGPVPHRRRRRPRVQRAAGARPRHRRAEPRRPAPPAGPRRAGRRAAASFRDAYPREPNPVRLQRRAISCRRAASHDRGARGATSRSTTASVAIAAITSCTNTSNPSVMVGAGLLAKKAVERGLESQPWVKTSLAPGSRVVTDYLERAGPAGAARRAALQPRRLRLHHLHRQLRPAARRAGRRRSPSTTWPSPRCSPATATSRAASTRRCARATSPRRRWSSPTRWPARSTSTYTEPLGTDSRRRAGVPARHLADAGGDRRR